MLTEKQMENFAELAVRIGVNMQKDQEVVVRCDINCKDFARLITKKAYEFGAKRVHVQWSDEKMSRITMDGASTETLCQVPSYVTATQNYFVENNCCLIAISASDPDNFKGCDAEKMTKVSIATAQAGEEFDKAIMSNKLRWLIVSVPTPAWAKKVFPNLSEAEAVDALWAAIGKTMRLDEENPTEAWKKHIEKLNKRAEFLNKHNFEYIHLSNGCGTDLKVGLAKNHAWLAAEEQAQDGVKFIANMPTEEVFTAPHKDKIDGVVVNALPLVYNGNVIDGFKLTFKEGKVVDFSAETGYETLKGLLSFDEGVRSLGEIALIGKHSPIAESGILFYNTLFDENASCHLALGASYPTTAQNGNDLNEEQRAELGMNYSLEHVDFMVGTPDLDVDGIAYDGTVTPLFRSGEWVTELD